MAIAAVCLAPLHAVPPLDENAIHVWHASTRPQGDDAARLRALLSPDELYRCTLFRHGLALERFVGSRAIQRMLLAGYTSTDARAIRFLHGPHGKPMLEKAHDLQFNVSNSGDRAIYAVARGFSVGIDLEELRPLPDAVSIAERFFSAPDADAVRRAPDAERSRVFLDIWVRLEALAKACGDGLSLRLADVAVSPTVPGAMQTVTIIDPASGPRHWSIRRLRVGSRFVAAIVSPAASPAVHIRTCGRFLWTTSSATA